MKLKHLLSSLLLAGVLSFGIGSLTNHSLDTTVEEADAADTLTLYVNHFNPGADKGGSWSNFKYYLFGTGGDNGWPGQSFTDSMKTLTPNEFDEYQYKLEIDTSKYQSMVLTGKSDSSWNYSFAKTEDIVLADLSGNGLYCGAHKGWQTDANVFAIGTYTYTTKTIYMLDLKGDVYSSKHYCHTFATGHSGTTWPGVAMTKVPGQNNLYSVEINSTLDNVIFNNYGSNQTDTINGISGGDSFVLYPDNGYNKLTFDAASFVDKYMKFETVWLDNSGTGACKTSGWYSSAKSAFTPKTQAQKNDILAHEPTKYRLQAWAAANNDYFDISNGTITSQRINPIINGANDTAGISMIVITSLASITAIGGYFYLRKRKED